MTTALGRWYTLNRRQWITSSKGAKIDTIKKHLAIFGNVKMLRVYCRKCKSMTLVRDNIKLFCDAPNKEENIKKIKEEVYHYVEYNRKKKGITYYEDLSPMSETV